MHQSPAHHPATTPSDVPLEAGRPSAQGPHGVAPRRQRRRTALSRFFGAWVLHLVLILAAFTLVLPFVWMLCTSVKPLDQVNREDWLPQPRSRLLAQDIVDPQRFISMLAGQASVAAHLRNLLPEETQQALVMSRDAWDDQDIEPALLATVRLALNDVLTGDQPIYDADAFASVQLQRTAPQLIERKDQLRGDALHRFNRLLLEDALAPTLADAPRFQWGNYAEVFRQIPFLRYYWNSLFIAASITFLKVFTSSLAAFAFARLHWPGRDKVFLLYLATMMLPGLVMMIPNYQIMIYLGLVDTMLGLILPGAFTAFGVFLLRQFMLTIPTSLDEAAAIDGASKWRLYWDIILPLARPGLITLTIFVFIGSYHSFFWPLVMLKSQHKFTLPIGLLFFESDRSQQTNLLMAAVAMSIVPLVIVFVLLQKYLVKGIQLGAVKG